MAWRQTVSDAMYQALCAAFRIDPSSEEGMKRFVPAYIYEATTPIADRNMNVCYYDIRPGSEDGFRYIETTYSPKTEQTANATIEKNIPITILLTFYGPNADDDSEYFWGLCQADLDYRSPRSILRKKNIVFSGKPEFPVGLDQVEGTYLRRRCDVRLNLVLYDAHLMPYETVEHIPDITYRLDEPIPDTQENGVNAPETPSEGTEEGNTAGDNNGGNSGDNGAENGSENTGNVDPGVITDPDSGNPIIVPQY